MRTYVNVNCYMCNTDLPSNSSFCTEGHYATDYPAPGQRTVTLDLATLVPETQTSHHLDKRCEEN